MTETNVMRVTTTMLKTLRELSDRTKIDMIVLLDDIFAQIQKQLDLCAPNKRLLFMADLYHNKNTPHPFTIVRLSDALMSSFDEMPPDVQKKAMETFGYKIVDGRMVDTTEQPEQPQKLTNCEQIQQKHDEDLKREEK